MTSRDAASTVTPGSGTTSVTLPFAPSSAALVRAQITAWLDAHGASDDLVHDCRLVVSELVGNSVRHASPLADGTLRIGWESSGNSVRISVTDGGAPGRPHVVDADTGALGGRGMAIISELCTRWWYDAEERGSTIHAAVGC